MAKTMETTTIFLGVIQAYNRESCLHAALAASKNWDSDGFESVGSELWGWHLLGQLSGGKQTQSYGSLGIQDLQMTPALKSRRQYADKGP